MAVEVLYDAKIWFAEFALTSDHNEIHLTSGYGEQDDTVFGKVARSTAGTIATVDVQGSGFVTLGSGQVHEVLRANLNVASIPFTVAAQGGDDGEMAQMTLLRTLSYKTGGKVGELMPFTYAGKGQGVPMVNGTILGVGSKTATANGTSRQLGAMPATKRLYAALHVLSVSGTSPTLDVVIASDDNSGFTSGTTRLTFAQKIAVGSEWLATAAAVAITDDYWRAQWTIGGTNTPTFNVVIVAGLFTLPA